MTGKDVLKLLLCSYGYDRNIDIQMYHGEGGCIGYEVNASNAEGDYYLEENCEGLMFHIYCILDYMKENKVPYKHDWWSIPVKDIINDEVRNNLLQKFDEHDECVKKSRVVNQPLFDWLAQNNPCIGCTINKHDHWDDVHYNCELNHNNSCELLKKRDKDFEEFKKTLKSNM